MRPATSKSLDESNNLREQNEIPTYVDTTKVLDYYKSHG